MPILASLRANIAATIFGGLAAILLAICLYQSVQIHGFLWIDGLEDEIADCARDRNELRAITSKKNEQAERTKVVIREVEKRIKVADKQAEKVENAPLPGNCETPAEIMGADL